MVVVERYPELKSDQNFRDLQAQLEGTENRITVARNRYIQAVQDYNVTVRKFPVNLTAMVFGYNVKPNFSVENEARSRRPPTVDFGTPAHDAGTRRRLPDRRPRLRPTDVRLASVPRCAARGIATVDGVPHSRRSARWRGLSAAVRVACALAGAVDARARRRTSSRFRRSRRR